MKIRTGDTVKILSGKDRGKRAKVIRVFPKDSRLLVEGANLRKKHQRSRRQDKKGEIILIPAPLAASAVQVVCPGCSKPTRSKFKMIASGEKERQCSHCSAKL